MKYNFDRVPCRKGTSCEKYDGVESVFGCDDIIPLWIADMDFEIMPAISEAICERARHPLYGYGRRCDSYYDAIVGWVERRHGWRLEREWLGFTPGVVAGFSFAIRALSAEGDGVLIQPPVYPPFAQMIRLNGRRVVDNPLRLVEGRFEIDFEDMDRKLGEAKLFLMCNPHNPTGRVFTREELERIAELCRSHGVPIISDEIHADLTFPPFRHIPIAALGGDAALRTVTFMAPSKTFNIAGLSTSVSIIPGEELRARFCAEFEKTHADQGNTFGTVALQAAYNHGDEWLDEVLAYIRGNIDFVRGRLAERMPRIRTFDVEGTFLMWLDFRELGLGQQRLKHFLVRRARLGLNDGEMFGREGVGFMRMNVATSRALLQRALEQLEQAYAAL